MINFQDWILDICTLLINDSTLGGSPMDKK